MAASSRTLTGLAILLLVPLAAQHAEAQHSKPTPGLRHGTLLLSSVTLLDTPAAAGATTVDNQQDVQSPMFETGPPGRCCLSLKAYAAALQPGSSGTAAQQGHSSSIAPLATFSSCINSTRSGCTKALLDDSSSSESNTYQVALLLPSAAHSEQRLDPSPGPSTTAAANPETRSDTYHSSGVVIVSGSGSDDQVQSDSPAVQAAEGQHSSAPRTAQRSSMQDMLVTVHAEQEVAGQVYLAVSAQLVQAGVGVVRLAINMSHFSHTWTHPDALVDTNISPATTNSTEAAPVAAPDAPATADMLDPEQLPSAGNSTAWLAHCPSISAQEPAPNPSTPPAPAQQTQEDLVTCHAAIPALLEGPGAFLPAVLQAQIAADPAVMAAYLHLVLGHSNAGLTSGPTGLQHATSQHSTACAGSGDSSSRGCGCPALLDVSAGVPPEAWINNLQEVLLTCPNHASLSSAVAAAAGTSQLPYAQPCTLLSSLATFPGVSAVLDILTSWVQPMMGAAGPQQLREAVLLIAIAATPVLLLCCLLLISKIVQCAARISGTPRQPAPATVTAPVQRQQQQAAAADARIPAAVPPVHDAWAPQQHVQYETLDQHMQDIDDDIFGYGAPPAPAITQAAAAPASSGQQGSMLAAIRRASAMAAGEAAGALKDAFMRRQTNQPAGAGAGTGLAGLGKAAGAGRAERDWLEEEDEDRVNQAPETIQRQLAAGGRWQRDGEGRLVRGSWQAVRKSLTAAANAVMAAVGSGGKAAAAAAGFGPDRGAAGPADAAGWVEGGDADALQALLSAQPGAVVSFTGN